MVRAVERGHALAGVCQVLRCLCACATTPPTSTWSAARAATVELIFRAELGRRAGLQVAVAVLPASSLVLGASIAVWVGFTVGRGKASHTASAIRY